MTHNLYPKKRMEEHASTMEELTDSRVLAHHSILVNAVKLIGVIFINAKVVEPVLLLLSTIFQYHNVNAREIMVGQLVIWTCAQTLNVEAELVLVEPVSVMKTTSTMETFVLTFVKVSIVELVVLVIEEFVNVMKVMPMLAMFVWICVTGSTVEVAVSVQLVSVAVY